MKKRLATKLMNHWSIFKPSTMYGKSHGFECPLGCEAWEQSPNAKKFSNAHIDGIKCDLDTQLLDCKKKK